MAVEKTRPGDILIDENGTLWRCVLWTDQPTMTIETVEMDDEVGRSHRSGVVSAPIFNGFKRLVPEAEE